MKGQPLNLDPQLVADLYRSGMTLREIAWEFSCGEETIRRVLRDNGVPRRPRGQPVGKYRPAGGLIKDKMGYVLERMPHHPYANSAGYVRQHRLVMEGMLGRLLEPEEVVHHINNIKDDNRPENLKLYASNGDHKREDMLGNSWSRGDVNNPKRRVRTVRSPEQILIALRMLAQSLERPIQRNDLVPPQPSYRSVARAFGSWREGVRIALAAPSGLNVLDSDHSDWTELDAA